MKNPALKLIAIMWIVTGLSSCSNDITGPPLHSEEELPLNVHPDEGIKVIEFPPDKQIMDSPSFAIRWTYNKSDSYTYQYTMSTHFNTLSPVWNQHGSEVFNLAELRQFLEDNFSEHRLAGEHDKYSWQGLRDMLDEFFVRKDRPWAVGYWVSVGEWSPAPMYRWLIIFRIN